MKLKIYKGVHKGFVALIAVLLLSTATLVFSLVTTTSAWSYFDTVQQRELRIQSKLNLGGCLESLKLMIAKDFFLEGKIVLREFGCEADVENDIEIQQVKIMAVANLNGVKTYGTLVVSMNI